MKYCIQIRGELIEIHELPEDFFRKVEPDGTISDLELIRELFPYEYRDFTGSCKIVPDIRDDLARQYHGKSLDDLRLQVEERELQERIRIIDMEREKEKRERQEQKEWIDHCQKTVGMSCQDCREPLYNRETRHPNKFFMRLCHKCSQKPVLISGKPIQCSNNCDNLVTRSRYNGQPYSYCKTCYFRQKYQK